MKKFLVIACALLLGISSAKAEAGQMAVGGNVLYGTEIKNVGIGAKYQLGIWKDLRAEAGFNYFFNKEDDLGIKWHMWELNLNAHWVFGISSKVNIYPLVGLTYVSYATHGDSHGKFGLNLGGGVEYNVIDHLALFGEIKYSLVSKYDQAVFGIGAMYKF
ncbi:MAG: porin family protein [Muribaculaceae bacterium]|nr:porin family protein [Muribaculaceae bacterium]